MLQYLILNNRIESAKSFNHVSNLTWKQQLLSSFSKGHRESFLVIFDLLRKQQKLEFYLRVYFLIFSIHPHLNQNTKAANIPEKQINCFRDFLDTKGADLAKTSEFLEFYALPFIKKPLEHATFKTLFTKNWVSNLKQKLNTYIQIQQEYMNQAVNCLFSLETNKKKEQKQSSQPAKQSSTFVSGQVSGSKNALQQKFKKLQQKNNELFHELETIKQRYRSLENNHQQMIEDFNQYMMDSQNKWFQSYKELVKTAKRLLQMVANTLSQNPKIQRRYIQAKKKIEKYERFVARKLQDLMSLSQDISIFDKPSINQISQYTMKSGYTSKSWIPNVQKSYSHNINNITSYVQIDEYIATNYHKLNKDFMKLSEPDQNLIIEGFCWRLIKAKSKQIRRFYCIGIIKNNFLGIGKIDPKSQQKQLQLCTKYLTDKSISITVLQLLNYIKVDYYSRQHLFKQHNITYSLMEQMAESLQQGDLQSFLISLDIISTITAYKDYRESILQSQLPIFLLNILESYPKLFESEEIMELIMMILINFSSFQEGLKLFEEYENVFSTLSVAFQQDFHDIMVLVNGLYYTLLTNRKLYEVAHESNMPEFVKYLLSSQQYKAHERQLKFIQSRLHKFYGDQFSQQSKSANASQNPEEVLFLIDGQQGYEDIEVIMEDELENLQHYIKGHELLSSKYGLREKEADEQEKQIKSIEDEFTKKTTKEKQKSFQKKDKPLNIELKQEARPISIKNIPEQSRIKKPVEMKSEQIQVSIVKLDSVKSNQQSSIKQQLFRSPPPKVDIGIETEQPIPKNSKEAQFMGISTIQKNPTFAKQKTEPIQKFTSPLPPNRQNMNLPKFGVYSPLPQLGPQQKTRRKQILKQINEEIQQKNKQKAQKLKSKSKSDKNVQQKIQIDNPNPNDKEFQRIYRQNFQMGIEQPQKSKLPTQEIKAFESRPKINRTPPKDEDLD